MHQVEDRVRLVDASEIGDRGVRTSVRRDEIEDVLKAKDGDPELVLDVTLGDEPAQTLRLAWDPAELDELLRRADGENVWFAFDGSELERLLDDDVAAHGLRQGAAVLAVAATTAVAGAGMAQAKSTVVSEHEWPQAVPASTAAAPTSEQEWPQLVTGDAAAAPAATQHQAFASEQEWPQAVSASTAAAPTSENEWPQLVTGDATQAAPAATPVAATSSSDGTNAGTAAAIAGGAALLIAGAAFTVRRQQKVEPKPV
jgi:hypothetical protein